MRRWSGVMVHHSAGDDSADVEVERFRKQHRAKGWRDVGYHFVVERVGGAYVALMGRPLNLEGSHCPGVNSTHIGVCFVGNFEHDEMPRDQFETGAQLIAGLCDVFKIEPEEILGHNQRRATLCPGAHFPLEALRLRVRALVETG